MKRQAIFWIPVFLGMLVSCNKDDANAAEPVTDTVRRLRITIGDRTLTARLYENPTAQDFVSRLPWMAEFSDYASAEKVFTPSPALTTKGSPPGLTPKTGDIALFVPWGNIAIFYRDGSSSGSLIPIGRIENGVEVLKVPGSVKIKFERIDHPF